MKFKDFKSVCDNYEIVLYKCGEGLMAEGGLHDLDGYDDKVIESIEFSPYNGIFVWIY